VSDDTAQAAGEGMSEERLAQIRALIIQPASDDGTPFAFLSRRLAAAVELLAEVKRLHDLNAELSETLDVRHDETQRLRAKLATRGDLMSGLDAEVDRLAGDNAKLRARLAEIGETEVEWGVRGTSGIGDEAWVGYAICETEEQARVALDHYRAVDRNERNPVERALVKRLAGRWREVPDA